MTTYITFDGVTQSVRQWALDYGIPESLIRARLKDGWTEGRAVSEPMPSRPGRRLPARFDASKLIHFGGRSMYLSDWAHQLDIKYNTLKMRLAKGWSVERAFATKVRSYESKEEINNRIITYKGMSMTINEWSSRLGIDKRLIVERLKNSYSIEVVLSSERYFGKRSLPKSPFTRFESSGVADDAQI